MPLQAQRRIMHLVIFGASGGVGSKLVDAASARGHQVRAVYRKPPKGPVGSQVESVEQPDLSDPAAISRLVEAAETVVSSVGLRRSNPRNPWSPVISPPNLNERFSRTLFDAMIRTCPKARLFVLSAAGVGDSWSQTHPLLRMLFQRSNVGVCRPWQNGGGLRLEPDRLDMCPAGDAVEWNSHRERRGNCQARPHICYLSCQPGKLYVGSDRTQSEFNDANPHGRTKVTA